MRKIHSQGNTLVAVLVALVVIGGLWYLTSGKAKVMRPVISGFNQCVAFGYPVTREYPRECRTPNGRVYRENELAASAVLTQPPYTTYPALNMPNYNYMNPSFAAREYIQIPIARSSNSNYSATGARVVPVVSRDSSSNVSYYGGGTSSGSTYYEQTTTSGGSYSTGRCYVGGCSGQICSDNPNAMSTCEYRPEYACYQQARCERQASGQCGWTLTAGFNSCMSAGSSVTTTAEYY